LQVPCYGAIVVNYNNQYLLKFWGQGKGQVIEKAIEIYNPVN